MKNYLSKKQEEEYKNFINRVIKDDPLAFEVISDAIVIPPKMADDGLFLLDNMYVEQFGVLNNEQTSFSKYTKRPTQDKTILPQNIKIEEYIDEKVTHIGLLGAKKFYAYGDSLFNAINKLWIFIEQPELLNYKICYFMDEYNKIPFELLELFGIKKENLIKIDKVTKVKEIVVPQSSFPVFGCRYSKKINLVVDKIKDNVKSKKYKKVYLSRRNYYPPYRTYGEAEIEKQFKKNGFKIIYPEKYSIKEQIAILKDCEFLVGTIGSNMHNAIFCNNNIKTAYLNRTEHINGVQVTIDLLKDFQATYIDVYTKLFTSYGCGVPHLISFNYNLKRFFNDNNLKYKKKIRKQTELFEFVNAMTINPNVMNDVFNIYSDVELNILNNFRRLLKKFPRQLPLLEKIKNNFKLCYYIKTGKLSKAKKYYARLYR